MIESICAVSSTMRMVIATIRVGICDDNAEHRKYIENMLKSYMEQKQLRCQCMCFGKGKSLWYEVEEGTVFDLLFLDIEMPELDGIELARRIKEKQPQVLLIFVSAHEKYVYDSFCVQPYRFIPKSRMEHMMTEVLNHAVEDIKRLADEFYYLENQQGIEKIPIRSIVYIWHEGKYAYLKKTDGEAVKVRKTLKRIREELPHTDFVWAGKSYLCNLAHVVQVKGECLKFSTGEQLYISAGQIASLKEQILSYWTKG